MIFLTVGTYPLPFDRLVRTVDTAIKKGYIEEEVFGQIGRCNYRPLNMEYVEMLEKEMFDSYVTEASSIISHAGIGTIKIALDNNKPLLVMPRLKKYGEVVNDHQVATARKFEELGHILAVYEAEDLPKRIEQLKSFVPTPRQAQPKAVADRIAHFLRLLSENHR
jgi:UDP-N-acetylglucosamine transferase subunit ALG13